MARCAWCVCRLGLLQIPGVSSRFIRAHGVAASHPLCMRKAFGSIPSVSICFSGLGGAGRCTCICHCPMLRRFDRVVSLTAQFNRFLFFVHPEFRWLSWTFFCLYLVVFWYFIVCFAIAFPSRSDTRFEGLLRNTQPILTKIFFLSGPY